VCFRVAELQTKLSDQEVERRSADSASSPVDDELRDLCDASFSSDRLPAFRPPPPPVPPPHPFFGYRYSPGFMPPFYGRRPPPRDQPQSPPAFDAHRGDPYMRESPRPRDISPPVGERPMASEYHRSAPPFDNYHEQAYVRRSPAARGNSPQPRNISPPIRRRPMAPEYYRSAAPFDNYHEEAYMGRSPPPKGNSPPYYENHDGRRSPPDFGSGHREERYGRYSPSHARENSPQWRKRHSRPPSDDASSAVPSSTTVRSHPTSQRRPFDKDNYHEEAYMGRSPPPRGNSPPYYENHDGRRLPPDFGPHHREERYGRQSPPQAHEETSGRSHTRSSILPGEERCQQSHPSRYTPERNVLVTDSVITSYPGKSTTQ